MKPHKNQTPANTSADESLVLHKEENGVVTITLNRPKQFNALSESMLAILQEKLEDIAENEAVRLVILQGAGKDFCAGHDLKEMIATRKEAYYKSLFIKCSKMMMTINKIPWLEKEPYRK